jgi:4-carboxymuconolactone decarboxylase
MAKAKAAKKAKPNPRNKKLYDDGMKMRKAVLGASYVDNSMANAATDDFMMSFQDITTEYAWGYVWTRPGLPKKTRSMLNLAMLAALNRGPELKLHVNGALNNGLTKEEIKEIFPAGRDLLRHSGQPRRLQDRERRLQGTRGLTLHCSSPPLGGELVRGHAVAYPPTQPLPLAGEEPDTEMAVCARSARRRAPDSRPCRLGQQLVTTVEEATAAVCSRPLVLDRDLASAPGPPERTGRGT